MHTTDPTYRGLLADILAHPDKDGPRLVCADWLQEHGEDERAEFIRVQCRIAAGELPDCTRGCPRDDCLRCILRRREGELLARYGDAWVNAELGPVGSWESGKPWLQLEGYIFCRGFVEEVTCTAADWLAHAEAMLVCQPIRAVTLTTWPDTALLVGRRAETGGNAILDRGLSWHAYVSVLLAAEWPGIRFALPEDTLGPPLTLDARSLYLYDEQSGSDHTEGRAIHVQD